MKWIDPVMRVSRHFKLSPERVFVEAAKQCGYHDFPRVARIWYLEWLACENLHYYAKDYLLRVIGQCKLK